MNQTIAAVVMVIACLAASATQAQTPETLKVCKDVSHMARDIMEVRQKGAPMSEMMELTAAGDLLDGINKILVVRAYDVPQFQTEPSRLRAVQEFENDSYLRCYKLRTEAGK